MTKYGFIILLMFFTTFTYGEEDYIPPQAFNYKHIIENELNKNFPYLYNYNYIPSLIEHESCIGLKHRRCWNSLSRLKTAREEGAGLMQITRTYRKDGSIRFDKLSELRDMYKEELKEAKWATIYQRPDIQIRAGILMLRDDYKRLYSVEDKESRLQMVDAAYNGGIGGLLKERRACGLSKNCNPDLWFDNVEKFCLKSKEVLYGTRSACDINRYHVSDVFKNNLPKYNKYYFVKEQ